MPPLAQIVESAILLSNGEENMWICVWAMKTVEIKNQNKTIYQNFQKWRSQFVMFIFEKGKSYCFTVQTVIQNSHYLKVIKLRL